MAQRDVQERLQQLVDRQVAKKSIHNLAAGIHSPERGIDAVSAGGKADARRSVVMTVDTPYYLASITKMYTATVVMKLAGQGRLQLTDPISIYLDQDLIKGIHIIDHIEYVDKITISHLLNQTSGLADYFEGKPTGGTSLVDDLKAGNDREISITDIVDTVRRLQPAFPPGAGKRAQYSDTNYALLGAIIEKVTSTSVSANFEEMIFEPLGLDATYVFDHSKTQPWAADAYIKNRALDIPLAMSSFAPDGGIVSTLKDSLRFLRGFFSEELLTSDQLKFMTSQWRPVFFPLKYGYGLMQYKPPRWMSPFAVPPELVGHSGSTGSFAFYNPEQDVYLAGTVNQMHSPSRPYRFVSQIMALLD